MTKENDFVKSLAEYQCKVLEIGKGFKSNTMLYRGQNDAGFKVESGMYRRIPAAKKSGFTEKEMLHYYIKSHVKLINDAKKSIQSHTIMNGMSDLEILAELQHYSAGTCLIDFTMNAFVALYFACDNKSTDGKVFCLDKLKIRLD